MFEGKKLRLDENLVPIIKVPKVDSNKKHLVIHNMWNVLGKSHQDTFPLIFMGLGLRTGGMIPHPISPLSDASINKIRQSLKDSFDVLSNLENECRELWNERHSYETLFQSVVDKRVSVPAAACYARKFEIERVDMGMTSLEFDRVSRILDVALEAEKNYKFFVKFYQMVKKSLYRIDV